MKKPLRLALGVGASLALAMGALVLCTPQAVSAQEAGTADSTDVSVSTGAAGSAEDTASTRDKKTLLTLIKEGGWAMWPLGLLSIGVIGLAIYNILDLKAKNFHPDDLSGALEGEMEQGQIEAVMQRTETSPTCLGQIVYGAMDYIMNRGYGVLDGEHLDNLMADASRSFNRKRARTINYFSVIAQAAPMLGLLGTVSGMIKAFGNLSQSGMADPGKLAGNISEALVTTASGLVIALPAIFCYFAFRDRLGNLVHDSDEKASHLMNKFRNAIYTQEHGEPELAAGHGGHAEEHATEHKAEAGDEA